MNPEALFKVLSDIHPLSGDFKKALEKHLIPLSLPKNHLLLEAPKIASHAYFLNKGFAMAYVFIDGKKNAEAFWKQGQIVLSSNSFFEQVPSAESIQLMQKGEVLGISYESVQSLFSGFPEANHLYRIIMNRHYEHLRNRIHDMQRLSAAQRFEKLLHTFAHIEQIIPQDHIASYLGITPQSLSRIKRQKGDH